MVYLVSQLFLWDGKLQIGLGRKEECYIKLEQERMAMHCVQITHCFGIGNLRISDTR